MIPKEKHVKSIALVAAQLFVMFSYDVDVKAKVAAAGEPFNKLIDIGFEIGLHDVAPGDIDANNDLAFALEDLFEYNERFCKGA